MAAPPRPGEALEVAPGVLWVRMPLPFQLDHVNLWLIADGDGWFLVDTGIGSDQTRDLWRRLEAGPLAGRALTRVLATHMHPDHAGLAGWLVARTGAAFLMARMEWAAAMVHALDGGADRADHYRRFYANAGVPQAMASGLSERDRRYRAAVWPLPQTYRRVRAGDVLSIGGRDWRVSTGGGHSPEQVLLSCPDLDLIIIADQVLPAISPNISVQPPEPFDDPLGDFLASLDDLAAMPGDPLVLPSHGLPFYGLGLRARALTDHHRDRLDEAWEACAGAVTAMDVQRALFRPDLDRHQMMFALGEALAHLNRLVAEGRVARRIRDGDAWRYERLETDVKAERTV
ncbi:MAG: MBL fold metallo-hydrolase [Inquilinaceae bacterium]